MSERMEHIEFTKEMKDTYTILFPNMAPLHFRMLKACVETSGYHAELLQNEGPAVMDSGLKYVHNDTCYPALLVIGQMIDALNSGKYDLDHTALIITQTGGGCRASNYIHLLRKALKNAGLEKIPVISMSFSNMEKNAGFKLTPALLGKMLSAIVYGDLLMLLCNQTKPYELKKGTCQKLVDSWIDKINSLYIRGEGLTISEMKKNFKMIIDDFSSVLVHHNPKVKVGIVGEIFVKYSPLANNHLQDFLEEQGCEVNTPGLMQFLLYTMDMSVQDIEMYGGSKVKKSLNKIAYEFLERYERVMIQALKKSRYKAPASYMELKEMVRPFINTGCKMGEGFLLTAEMAELTESGYENIVCCQPFGCLPNHIVGKAMMHKIRKNYDDSNIVAIDYDASASKVNQENRIKLMLSIAKENLEKKPKDIDDNYFEAYNQVNAFEQY